MGTFRLRSYEQTPPGGYWYEQTEGIHRVFKHRPIIEDVAKAVSSFRSLNGLPRPSVRESLEDIDKFTCARLGNPESHCISCEPNSTTVALGQSAVIINPPCNGCGAPVT